MFLGKSTTSGGPSGGAGSRGLSEGAGTWGRSWGAGTALEQTLAALWQRGHLGALWQTLAGALEVRTLHSTLEGLAPEGAVEERVLELGYKSYPHMSPASPGAHKHLWAGLWWPAGLRWPLTADLYWPWTAFSFLNLASGQENMNDNVL